MPGNLGIHNFPANAFPGTAYVNRSHRQLAATTISCSCTPKSVLKRRTIS
ncbi:MAG: hypothetical protein PHF57_12005 [Methanoregula sp.]|nr:hypothetical protein [Methanoregula sp.]MDD5024729.1 hypothetical protein [Methanoregula sp.]MDD5188918.1 hypothetical protein [Methanoregula sp.]